MGKSSPNLRDIAKEAGVSVATVSLALRKHASIPESTRERIRAVATKIGYRPNPRVAELMNHIRRNRAADALGEGVALFWSDSTKERVEALPYLDDFVQGVRECLRRNGYSLECYYQDPELKPDRLERMLRSKGIRGLILAPLMQSVGQTLSWNWNNFSTIVAGSANWQPDFNRVSFNHFGEMSTILRHLHEDGFHRIGLVVDTLLEARSQHTIVGGFWAALEVDVPKRKAFFEAGPDSRRDFFRWLEDYQPDSIIVAYPPALKWIKEAKKPVPVFLRMVQQGSENNAHPGIFQDFKRLGEVTAEQLIGQLLRNELGAPQDPLQTSITGSWRNRTV